jgi:hypothetical protein
MRLILLCGIAVCVCAAPLRAQVGHPPGSSPYRDIAHGKSFTALIGDVGGDGGRIGVGPHDGRSYGLRFDVRLSAPVQIGFSVARANLKRLVVSAADSVATRTKGPVDQDLTMIEASLQLNLTGRKTWHRLAPFIGGSLGWAHGSSLPSSVPDSSGYKFGSKFYLVPGAGVRVFISNSLVLRLEARQLFWKLSYPLAYTLEPAAQPSTDPNKPNAVLPDGKRSEWTGGTELRAGLGFAF